MTEVITNISRSVNSDIYAETCGTHLAVPGCLDGASGAGIDDVCADEETGDNRKPRTGRRGPNIALDGERPQGEQRDVLEAVGGSGDFQLGEGNIGRQEDRKTREDQSKAAETEDRRAYHQGDDRDEKAAGKDGDHRRHPRRERMAAV